MRHNGRLEKRRRASISQSAPLPTHTHKGTHNWPEYTLNLTHRPAARTDYSSFQKGFMQKVNIQL